MKNDSTPQISAEAPSPGVGSSDLFGSSFSEGPWRLHDMEFATIVQAKTGNAVGFFGYSSRHSVEAQEANARLAAAAPEMAEALAMIFAVGSQCSLGYLGEIQKKARAAFDKAGILPNKQI